MARPLLALALVGFMWTGVAHGFPITTCGIQIPDGDVGTLAADLNCTDPNTPAVQIGHRGTLELAGHAIQGISVDGTSSRTVVPCVGKKCTIVGPGSIAGNDGSSSYGDCVFGPFDSGMLTMTSNGQGEIAVSNCGVGVAGGKGKLQDVHAQSNVVGILVFRGVTLRNVTASGNQFGVMGNKVKAIDLDADANTRFGVVGYGGKGKVRLQDLSATGNGDAGVIGYAVTIKNGTVTGNAGYGQGIDVVSVKKPHVTDVACGLSGKIGESYVSGPPPLLAGTWGICAGD